MEEVEFSRFFERYTAIDDLKDYELTNCIAYEMAIRNKELLTLLYDLHFATSKDRMVSIIKTLDEGFYFNIKCINWFNQNFHFKYATIFAPELNIEVIQINDVKFYNIEDDPLKLNQYSNANENSSIDFNEMFIGFKLITNQTTIDPELFIYDFSRPTLSTKKEKEVLFEINPNFPKNEILTYVEHILDSLSAISKNDKIYTNAEFEEDTILDLMQIKDNAKLQNEVNCQSQTLRAKIFKDKKYVRPNITKANIFANKFLIYDYLTYKSQKDPETKKITMYENINTMINLFVREKFVIANGGRSAKCFSDKEKTEDILADVTSSSLDDKTIRSYYASMEDYIENKKYISLITT